MSASFSRSIRTMQMETSGRPVIVLLVVVAFLAVWLAWLGLAQKKRSWLALSLVAWLGFSLGRPEAPLVALLFLTLMISCNVFPWRISAHLILIYFGRFGICWKKIMLIRIRSTRRNFFMAAITILVGPDRKKICQASERIHQG